MTNVHKLLTSAHHAACHNPNIVTTTQRLGNVANPSSESNLRLLSQQISLHPKVLHMSLVLLPWKDFFWTDDSPLKPKQNVCCKCQHGVAKATAKLFSNLAWLKEIIYTAGLVPHRTPTIIV